MALAILDILASGKLHSFWTILDFQYFGIIRKRLGVVIALSENFNRATFSFFLLQLHLCFFLCLEPDCIITPRTTIEVHRCLTRSHKEWQGELFCGNPYNLFFGIAALHKRWHLADDAEKSLPLRIAKANSERKLHYLFRGLKQAP
jgi:hypothetical protein